MAQHKVVQFKYAEILANAVTTSQIFTGDSSGQSNCGSKIAEITMTPKNANNKILLDVSIPIVGESGDHSYGYGSAIYQDSSNSAISLWLLVREHNDQGGVIGNGNANHQDPCAYVCSVDAGSTTERTYKLHFGCTGGNANINGAGGIWPDSNATTIQSLFTATEIEEI